MRQVRAADDGPVCESAGDGVPFGLLSLPGTLSSRIASSTSTCQRQSPRRTLTPSYAHLPSVVWEHELTKLGFAGLQQGCRIQVLPRRRGRRQRATVPPLRDGLFPAARPAVHQVRGSVARELHHGAR